MERPEAIVLGWNKVVATSSGNPWMRVIVVGRDDTSLDANARLSCCHLVDQGTLQQTLGVHGDCGHAWMIDSSLIVVGQPRTVDGSATLWHLPFAVVCRSLIEK